MVVGLRRHADQHFGRKALIRQKPSQARLPISRSRGCCLGVAFLAHGAARRCGRGFVLEVPIRLVVGVRFLRARVALRSRTEQVRLKLLQAGHLHGAPLDRGRHAVDSELHFRFLAIHCDLREARANPFPKLRAPHVTLALDHESGLLGHVCSRSVEGHAEAFLHLWPVWWQGLQDLLGRRLRQKDHVARETFLCRVFVLAARSQQEEAHNGTPRAQGRAHSGAEVAIQRVHAATEEIVREGERWHLRLADAQRQDALSAEPSVLPRIADTSAGW